MKLAQQLQDKFDYMIWQSLRHAPLIGDELATIIGFISNHQKSDLSNDFDSRISLLIDYLYRYRSLIILDNVESIFEGGELAGKYRGKLFIIIQYKN